MKTFDVVRGAVIKGFRLLLVAGLQSGSLSFMAMAQQPKMQSIADPSIQTLSPEERQKRVEWQRSISQVPIGKKGCFESSYPQLEWREVPCGQRSNFPNPPAKGPRATVVGQGNDISAQVSGPKIFSAIGTFDSITPVTATVSGRWHANPNAANAFTIQINSQFFSTPACDRVSGCLGWQQFIYSQNQCGGPCIFMQYWLIDYGPKCPPGPWRQHDNNCWFNSDSAVAPAIASAQLQGTTLTGTASVGIDTVVLTSPAGHALGKGADSVVSLALEWNTAEFNIFGDCCSRQANFSAGTAVVTRIQVNNGTTFAPTCITKGFTGETNNLSFGPSAPAASGTLPAIIFNASTTGGSPSNCAAATTIGNTHLTTFDGLLYDFRATGDFLLADTGSDFVVQARQVSGAPKWPHTSANKAVAVQTGKNRVVVCLVPSRVLINGKLVDLPDGQQLQFRDGGDVVRRGNVYMVRGPRGDSVRAIDHATYIDVFVGLGRWPSKVHGLLANSNSVPNSIETRDGQVLTSPFSYEALYGRFTESWRVPGSESMLAACGQDVERGVPKKFFFATDLDPQTARRAQTICARAGVKDGPLLDACTLDVAVIGSSNAAKVFVTTPSPAVK